MSIDLYPTRGSEPESWQELISYNGNGTGTPTKVYGRGVTVARTGTGVWLITFTDPPGNFVGFNCEFQAATPGGVAGYSGILGTFTAASGATKASVSLNIYTGGTTPTLTDLTSAQMACLTIWFKRSQSSI